MEYLKSCKAIEYVRVDGKPGLTLQRGRCRFWTSVVVTPEVVRLEPDWMLLLCICVCLMYVSVCCILLFMFLFACMVSFLSCHLLLYVYTGLPGRPAIGWRDISCLKFNQSINPSPFIFPFVLLLGAQVSFTSLYVYFISEFTEVINSLLSLSCDSLAMLCKHI